MPDYKETKIKDIINESIYLVIQIEKEMNDIYKQRGNPYAFVEQYDNELRQNINSIVNSAYLKITKLDMASVAQSI